MLVIEPERPERIRRQRVRPNIQTRVVDCINAVVIAGESSCQRWIVQSDIRIAIGKRQFRVRHIRRRIDHPERTIVWRQRRRFRGEEIRERSTTCIRDRAIDTRCGGGTGGAVELIDIAIGVRLPVYNLAVVSDRVRRPVDAGSARAGSQVGANGCQNHIAVHNRSHESRLHGVLEESLRS